MDKTTAYWWSQVFHSQLSNDCFHWLKEKNTTINLFPEHCVNGVITYLVPSKISVAYYEQPNLDRWNTHHNTVVDGAV